MSTDRRYPLSRRFGWLLVVVAGIGGFATVLELAQFCFPPRTPAKNDIVAQTLGGILGAGLCLVCGDFVTKRLRAYFGGQPATGRFPRLLEFYLAGLLIYRVLPLDVTISPVEIYRKFKTGAVVLMPQLPPDFNVLTIYGLVRDVALWVPVGMLASYWAAARRLRHRFWWSVACGGAIVVLSEFSQLFVLSHYTTANAVLLGLIGVVLGAWSIEHYRARSTSTEPAKLSPPLQALLWAAAAILLTAGFGWISCLPNEPVHAWTDAEARLAAFLHRLPFAAFYGGSPLNIIPQVTWKVGAFALVGGAMTMALHRAAPSQTGRRWISLAAGIYAAFAALAIELLQVFLPPHVPDVTDILLCVSGAILGVALTHRLWTPTGDA